MELRADALYKIRGRAEIALLIASHQRFENAVRVHQFECLPATNISTSVFAQFVPRRQALSQIASPPRIESLRWRAPESYARVSKFINF